MKYLGSQILETERTLLRPTIETDLYILWKILGNKEVSKYYLVGKYNTNWLDEKKWQYKKLERALNKDVFQWTILLKETNEPIGQICCQSILEKPDYIRDLGWFIDKPFQGKGIGTEVSKKLVDYMFKEVGIEKIETCAAITNTASWRLMEKMNFNKTDKTVRIKYTFLENEEECICYEITRDEYLEYSKSIYKNKKIKEI